MCIICNAKTPKGEYIACEFLIAFAAVNTAMRQAERLMLQVSENSSTEAIRSYRRAHKAMVRARRDWNRIEQIREAGR